MILSLIELTPIPGNRQKILELFRFTAERLETRVGCLGSRVYQADLERGAILYVEQWESPEDFHRYVRSPLYLGVLNALDLAEAPREICFYEISGTKSMELVAALRNSGAP